MAHMKQRGRRPFHLRLISSLCDDIAPSWADLPLLACCAVSGLCDSVAFNATSTFASMQTGNTIFLALGAAHLPPNQRLLWLRALVSIACFVTGCFAFASLRHVHPRRKATLAVSFLVQGSLIIVSAALGQTGAVAAWGQSRIPSTMSVAQMAARDAIQDDSMSMLPLALMSFQAGGQIVTSRVLAISEVPTNVLTSLYCDLLSDPLLLAAPSKNPKRNRRFAAIVLLIIGGVAGGWLQRSSAGMSAALWIAAAIKLGIALAWLGWKSKGEAKTSGGIV